MIGLLDQFLVLFLTIENLSSFNKLTFVIRPFFVVVAVAAQYKFIDKRSNV